MIASCPNCGGIATSTEELRAHTRSACEQRIRERIQQHQQAIEQEQERLEALHAVRGADWKGAMA